MARGRNVPEEVRRDAMTERRKKRRGMPGATLNRFLAMAALLPAAGRAPVYARLVWALIRDERVPASRKALLGGALGMLLGGGVAWGVNAFTPNPAVIPIWSVVAAITASAVTGIFFGMYPASKASRLDPVEALRYE